MKKISTLLAAVIAALSSNAQIAQNFDGGLNSLTAACRKTPATATYPSKPISTTGGVSGAAIQMASTGSYDLSTPHLKFAGTFTISFDYLIDDNLSGQASRSIQVGRTDKNGAFTAFGPATSIDNKSFNKTTPFSYTGSLTDITSRITIRVVGLSGDGKCNVVIDNVIVTGTTFHYATAENTSASCNTAPVAADDRFTIITSPQIPASGNLIENDVDANTGESVAIVTTPVTQPTVGTVTIKGDGTFTYTPPATGFAGGLVTFQYRVMDNGYDATPSNVATVYLEYPEQATLPVKLVSFAGKAANEKAQLTWMVADNENAAKFEIQRSYNGIDFINTGLVFATNSNGAATYQFAETLKAGHKQYFRLKMWDNEGAFEYSDVVLLETRTTATSTALQLWQPSKSKLNLQFNAAAAQNMQLVVVNLLGAVVHQQNMNSTSGTNTISINLTQPLQPGVYLIKLQAGATASTGKLLVP